VGILKPEAAINGSITGPVLRASGVPWDLRRADPYEVYGRLQFDIPVGTVGDSYDRFLVRLEEMRQSVRILRQCTEQLPEGPFKTDLPLLLRPPAGEAYGCVEAPKGELGFYVVSDGSISPYRCAIRSPSFINLSLLREMLVGWKLADMIVIFGSIDINMGEVDR
jgi:NADH-quinone oxidoreductase subunit D